MMSYNPQAAYRQFKKWVSSCKASSLYQDVMHGAAIVRDQWEIASEQTFIEMEQIYLRYRLVQINKRLSNAYRRLGEQGLNEQGADTERRMEPIYQQIENILKNQEQALAEIEQVMTSARTAENEEIKNAE